MFQIKKFLSRFIDKKEAKKEQLSAAYEEGRDRSCTKGGRSIDRYSESDATNNLSQTFGAITYRNVKAPLIRDDCLGTFPIYSDQIITSQKQIDLRENQCFDMNQYISKSQEELALDKAQARQENFDSELTKLKSEIEIFDSKLAKLEAEIENFDLELTKLEDKFK
jgi:peptidoglycan hydrolase CwlO-like protein